MTKGEGLLQNDRRQAEIATSFRGRARNDRVSFDRLRMSRE